MEKGVIEGLNHKIYQLCCTHVEFMGHRSFKLVRMGFILIYKHLYACVKVCFIHVGVAVHHKIQHLQFLQSGFRHQTDFVLVFE